MIHHTCDCCKQDIDPTHEQRYVVRMQLAPAFESTTDDDVDEDRDYLTEICDMLNDDDGLDAVASDEAFRNFRFDLCPSCYRKFSKNPLGRAAGSQLHFSKN